MRDYFVIVSDNKVLECMRRYDNKIVYSWSSNYPLPTNSEWQFVYFLFYEDAKVFLDTHKVFNEKYSDGRDIFPPSALHYIAGVGYNDPPVDVAVDIVKLEAQTCMTKYFRDVKVETI